MFLVIGSFIAVQILDNLFQSFVKQDPQMLIKLTMAADNLGVPDLYEFLCHQVAIAFRAHSLEDLKEEFEFTTDLNEQQLKDFIER